MTWPVSVLVLLAAWTPHAASPSLLLAADHETGTLLTTDAPPGPYNLSFAPPAANSLTASASSAHRGGFGMELLDGDTSPAITGEGAVAFQTASTTSAFYTRFWFRLAASNDLGSFSFHEIKGYAAGDDPAVWLQITNPGGALELATRDDSLATTTTAAATVAVGAWHLIEVAAVGAGTASGSAALYMDGVPVASRNGISWSGEANYEITAGEPFSSSNRFTGQLDFDDLRLATAPHASTLQITAVAAAAAGDCVPVTVGLVDSLSSAPAPAPYAFAAALAASGVPVTWFADARCTTSTQTASFAPGSTVVQVYFVPGAAGSATLSAHYLDFLPGTMAVAISPAPADGGFDPSPDAGPTDAGPADSGAFDSGAVDSAGGDAGVGAGSTNGIGPGPGFDPANISIGCACGARGGPGGGLLVLFGVAAAFALRRRGVLTRAAGSRASRCARCPPACGPR